MSKLHYLRLHRRRVLPLVGLFCSTAVCLAYAAAPDPVVARAGRAVTARPRVLALYYGWYGTPQGSGRWQHYEQVNANARRIGSHTHYPALGPYDSADKTVLEKHVAQARAAGIQTLVCSWWGKGDQTDRSFRALLPIAARQGITVCPLYERVPKPGDSAAVLDEWRYLLAEYGKSEGLLKEDEKPVFFVYARAKRELKPEQWADTLATLEREAAPGVVALGHGVDLADALVFDGLYSFNPTPPYAGKAAAEVASLFQASHQAILERAARFRRIPVVTVTPGSQAAGAANESGALDRRGGDLYRQQWQEAVKVKGAWVLIDSFNQWHAGSEIEPSVEFGDQYLKITAEYTARLKPPVRVPINP